MIVSQSMIILDVVRKVPGLDLEGLSEEIKRRYGRTDAVRFMILGDDATLVEDRIKYMGCIERINGTYHFNPLRRPYSRDEILNAFIENYLTGERAQPVKRDTTGD